MVKRLKKPLSILLAAVMMIGLFVAYPTQAGAASIITSSQSGNTTVNIYSDSVLVVTGNGAMADYELNSRGQTTAPWFYVTQFGLTPKIVFGDGVTHVGKYAFYLPTTGNWNVHMINLSDTIETIGDYAFANIKKLKMVTLPASVKSIGEHAFEGCNNIETIKCFAEPSADLHLANIGLPLTVQIRVPADRLVAFQTLYPDLTFVGNLVPLATKPAGGMIEVEHYPRDYNVFGGILATSIKAYPTADQNNISPITYGLSGFPTCIRITEADGTYKYYGLDQNDGNLHRLTLKTADTGSFAGKEVGYVQSINTGEVFSDLSLILSYQYIGLNAVKVIYTVNNNTSNPISFKLGSAGDIKIGSDDYATIAPLEKDSRQIGITMTTNNNNTEDRDSQSNPLTLGFIAKEVGGSSSDAKFFYGKVNSTWSETATGVHRDTFNPYRVFEMNPGGIVEGTALTANQSYSSGEYPPSGTTINQPDSGLSYYWDVNLGANESRDYAVIFAVLGTDNTDKAAEVVNNVSDDIDSEPDYQTENNARIFFDDDVPVESDDTLAQANSYSSLKNFLLLGVQRKKEDSDAQDSRHMRFVSVVKTELLMDADEYGYLIAKTDAHDYKAARAKIDQLTYESPNSVRIDCTGTSNQISARYGDYNAGLYGTDTPYKYVTLAIENLPTDNNVTIMARFYLRKDGKTYYADYYNSEKNKFDGCAAKYTDLKSDTTPM